jgi:phosphatidylserine/phosphatidylglycerophosphate/cardiolipin synthase-like enzyme
LYLDLIAAAERCIYIENQYFASGRIAAAIAKRLDELDGPEIVVITPRKSDGWLEPLFMDTARARLVEALRRRDRNRRFRIYHPFTPRGSPIYVHSKIMIVDDVALRVGSSNVNSRSMRLDTECDIALHSTRPENSRANIRALRDGLLAEHLRIEHAEVAATIESCGSLVAAIELLRSRTDPLRPYETPDLSTVEEWLAEHDVLGSDEPEEPFEPLTRGSFFRRSKVDERSS